MRNIDPREMDDEVLLELLAREVLNDSSHVPADLLAEGMRRWPSGRPS